jgi:hypothetical protein
MRNWKRELREVGAVYGLAAGLVCAFFLGAGAVGIIAGGSGGEAGIASQILPYLQP